MCSLFWCVSGIILTHFVNSIFERVSRGSQGMPPEPLHPFCQWNFHQFYGRRINKSVSAHLAVIVFPLTGVSMDDSGIHHGERFPGPPRMRSLRPQGWCNGKHPWHIYYSGNSHKYQGAVKNTKGVTLRSQEAWSMRWLKMGTLIHYSQDIWFKPSDTQESDFLSKKY